ncbi:MAG: carboxypeptidase-like regulatory domain-containing protein [Planctomycetota bacterium]|jgi:hypothetical protein|nr:carboxypeptidase-like regulatory domain-containing protein [Planctomycetota bacterium]
MRSMNRIWQSALALSAIACALWCGGCGSSEPPTGQVAGKVTYQGEPVTKGVVTFVNSETGIGASSELDSSGAYRIESVRAGDYQVAIQPPSAPSPEEMAEGAKAEKSPIPAKYHDPQASGLTATVNEGANTADFDVQ